MQVQQIPPVTSPASELESSINVNYSSPETRARLELFAKGTDSIESECRYTILMFSRDDPSEVRAIRLACRNWQCRSCGPMRKSAWYAHLLFEMSKEIHLETLEMPVAEFEGFRKRISRQNDRCDGSPYQYARLCQSPDKKRICVITNLQDGGIPIPEDDLEGTLTEIIGRVPWVARPICTSRGWTMKNGKNGKDDQNGQSSHPKKKEVRVQLEAIGYSKLKPTEIRDIAERVFRIQCSASGYEGFSMTLKLPRELMEPFAFATFLINIGVRRSADAPDIDLADLDRRLREVP